MSSVTVCLTVVRACAGLPGGPSAAATLALEEKEWAEKNKTEQNRTKLQKGVTDSSRGGRES